MARAVRRPSRPRSLGDALGPRACPNGWAIAQPTVAERVGRRNARRAMRLSRPEFRCIGASGVAVGGGARCGCGRRRGAGGGAGPVRGWRRGAAVARAVRPASAGRPSGAGARRGPLFPRRHRLGRAFDPEQPDRGEDREQRHDRRAAEAPLAVGVDRERLAIGQVHAEQEPDQREPEAERRGRARRGSPARSGSRCSRRDRGSPPGCRRAWSRPSAGRSRSRRSTGTGRSAWRSACRSGRSRSRSRSRTGRRSRSAAGGRRSWSGEPPCWPRCVMRPA